MSRGSARAGASGWQYIAVVVNCRCPTVFGGRPAVANESKGWRSAFVFLGMLKEYQEGVVFCAMCIPTRRATRTAM
jgi:hypothetical protein